MSSGLRGELRALWTLALPLSATQLGNMLLHVVDTAVVGRLGEAELAGTALGGTWFFAVSVLGFGWMLALDPMIAQAVGAREHERARHVLWQGGWLALFGAAPLCAMVVGVGHALELCGIEAVVAGHARAYLYGRLFGMLPFLWFAAARAFLQAHDSTRALVIGVVVANVLNLPLDWLLVFGDAGLVRLGLAPLGVPALGTAGAGIASAIATCVQLGIAVAAVRAHWSGEARIEKPDRGTIIATIRLGTPIALALLFEVGSFSIVALLMGNLGTRALASHNVALTLISTTFQMAVALGAAAAVRVGRAIGRADEAGTRRAGLVAIGSTAASMSFGAVAFLTIPRTLGALITDRPGVIEAAVPLLAVAAAFQLSDGVQAVSAGALRGAGDTRVPLAANLIGHYAIGIPVGSALAFGAGLGAVGLWWGLSAGLTVVAIALSVRFWLLSKKLIRRV